MKKNLAKNTPIIDKIRKYVIYAGWVLFFIGIFGMGTYMFGWGNISSNSDDRLARMVHSEGIVYFAV